MGRPSRKRPRPPSLTEAENSAVQYKPRVPVLTGASAHSSSSLQSLVNRSSSSSSSSSTSSGKKDRVGEATLTVQHVWGALSEADVATASSSALSLGANIEIARAGVAWLVNTSTRGGSLRSERSSVVGALDSSQDQSTTPSHPQQPVSDHHASAAEEEQEETSKLAPLSDHDRNMGKTAPPPSVLFCACEASLREQLSRAKEEFDEIPVPIFKRVRSACNPAEALGSGSFLNRSAMKLANIDAIVEGLLAQEAPVGGSRKEDAEKEETPALGEGGTSQPLQFVDLCGGPGGFSEYLLRRRRQGGLPARGWGISLRRADDESGGASGIGIGGTRAQDAAAMDGRCMRASDGRSSPGTAAEEGNNARRGGRDGVGRSTEEQDPCAWRLDHLRPWCDLSVSTAETASTPTATKLSGRGDDVAKHAVGDGGAAAAAAAAGGTAGTAGTAAAAPLFEMRIDYGPNGTGDLTDEANMQAFVDTVLASTSGRRPGLVVADGGFGAARDALEQESLVSPLVHCEALAALLLLREGGVFVCKLFECWTESTAALVYLLHRKFRRIAIVKPVTSRPASGERYLVCIGFLPPPPSSPPGCRLTNALRAKVQALQEETRRRRRRRRRNCSSRPSPATDSPGSWDGQASCSVAQAGRGGGGGEVQGVNLRVAAARGVGEAGDNGAVSGGVGGGGDGGAVAGGRFDASLLGVEAEMKQDESFMSYLRLANNTLASLQAKACARIVDVASTKRGRAWAFRDSYSNRGVRGSVGSGSENAFPCMRGDFFSSCTEDTEESGGDAVAVRCFSTAWGLDGI